MPPCLQIIGFNKGPRRLGWLQSRTLTLADSSSQSPVSPDVCTAGSSLLKAQLQCHLLRNTFPVPHFREPSFPGTMPPSYVFLHSAHQCLKLSWLYVCSLLNSASLPPKAHILGEQSACPWCSPTHHRLSRFVDEGLNDHL